MLSEREILYLRKALTYANGYRELGMFDDALAELDRLSERQQAHTDHQQMRLSILMEAKRWRDALPFAHKLACNETSDPGPLVNLAYVTRRADSLIGARVILERAALRFPNEAIIFYNLGCYACCSEDLESAKSYLEKAFALDARFTLSCQEDEDLIPLRPWLECFADRC